MQHAPICAAEKSASCERVFRHGGFEVWILHCKSTAKHHAHILEIFHTEKRSYCEFSNPQEPHSVVEMSRILTLQYTIQVWQSATKSARNTCGSCCGIAVRAVENKLPHKTGGCVTFAGVCIQMAGLNRIWSHSCFSKGAPCDNPSRYFANDRNCSNTALVMWTLEDWRKTAQHYTPYP